MDIMTMSARTAEGLCEIVHDISVNLHCHLNSMEEGERDWLSDVYSGSRGLFWEHVLPWAHEYQNAWAKLSDAEKDAKDYLVDIDAYTKAKFQALLASVPLDVASVQVVPSFEQSDGCGGTEVVPQFGGPNEHTTQWSVYTRKRDGLAQWVADAIDERTAMLLGRSLAIEHNVKIEPQPWKEPKTTEVVVPAPAERFHVSWHIEVDATDSRAAALEALAIQRDPLSTATVFDVRDDGSDLAARIDLSEKAE